MTTGWIEQFASIAVWKAPFLKGSNLSPLFRVPSAKSKSLACNIITITFQFFPFKYKISFHVITYLKNSSLPLTNLSMVVHNKNDNKTSKCNPNFYKYITFRFLMASTFLLSTFCACCLCPRSIKTVPHSQTANPKGHK